MERFAEQVALITGAGSGIGAATARQLADEGATVILVGRTRGKLEEVAAGLPDGRGEVRVADVSDSKAVEELFAGVIEEFGRLDILVNNAGVFEGGALTEVDDEAWRQVMAINVDGVFYCCRAALPELGKNGGSIINTSSVSGLGGDWGAAPYNASKGAVSNLTRALALDFQRHGVRVNAVCPSLTDTDMAESAIEEKLEAFQERIPMGRPAQPEEVAAVIAFLASPEASFVNGALIPVDGGLSASNGQPPLG